MKKILSLLGAMTLNTITVTSVIACDSANGATKGDSEWVEKEIKDIKKFDSFQEFFKEQNKHESIITDELFRIKDRKYWPRPDSHDSSSDIFWNQINDMRFRIDRSLVSSGWTCTLAMSRGEPISWVFFDKDGNETFSYLIDKFANPPIGEIHVHYQYYGLISPKIIMESDNDESKSDFKDFALIINKSESAYLNFLKFGYIKVDVVEPTIFEI
ncbi:hypothetical protein SCLARK_00813 [Spiroplasma clarkii]|uniref:lipoprotein n=1 Tax=Spiroplasma clarkii TaxID=2139 RepID=UPI000B56F514|nr:lipoprotein [Spiroplasma clarkii]ARU91442.1 hypothetical protein SCLARK_00813 [Spiroplasma clarkii]